MPITLLKNSVGLETRAREDVTTCDMVTPVLANVNERGSTAIAELSEKLDSGAPATFRLNQDDSNALTNKIIR